MYSYMWIYLPNKNYNQYLNEIVILETVYGKIICGSLAGIHKSPLDNKIVTIKIETIFDTDMGISVLNGHSHHVTNDVMKEMYIDRTRQTHESLLLVAPLIARNTNHDMVYEISTFLNSDFLYI